MKPFVGFSVGFVRICNFHFEVKDIQAYSVMHQDFKNVEYRQKEDSITIKLNFENQIAKVNGTLIKIFLKE